jgi:Protein of unknown function (DUF1822)
LKERGVYDPIYRTYTVNDEVLIPDLDIILLAREICGQEKADIPSLPSLSETAAASLLAKLSQSSPYSPRLDIKFAQWGALLANDTWRQQLYIKRTTKAPTKMLVNLHHWLKNNFTESIEAGWRSVAEFSISERELVTVRNHPQSHNVQQAKLIE